MKYKDIMQESNLEKKDEHEIRYEPVEILLIHTEINKNALIEKCISTLNKWNFMNKYYTKINQTANFSEDVQYDN